MTSIPRVRFISPILQLSSLNRLSRLALQPYNLTYLMCMVQFASGICLVHGESVSLSGFEVLSVRRDKIPL